MYRSVLAGAAALFVLAIGGAAAAPVYPGADWAHIPPAELSGACRDRLSETRVLLEQSVATV